MRQLDSDEIQNLLNIDGLGLWRLIDAIPDWDSARFSVEKMSLMGLFSKFAYLNTLNFEYENVARAKLVPSLLFQHLIETRTRVYFDDIRRFFDIQNQTISTEYYVITLMRIRQVVVIAIRGTEKAIDWKINLNLFKTRGGQKVKFGSAKFHSGFYEQAKLHTDLLLQRQTIIRPDDLVYLTGHSLGGAIAAIANVLLINNEEIPEPVSAYTFGMPRYGNSFAVMNFRSPYACIRSHDVVPRVPPKTFSFSDTPLLHDTKGQFIEKLSRHSSWLKWPTKFRLIREHSMDSYLSDITDKS